MPQAGKRQPVERQGRNQGDQRIAAQWREQRSRVDQEAGQAPDEVGRSEKGGRKVEQGNALRRQTIVVRRLGHPQVERQRVPNRCLIIDRVAAGNGEPRPTHLLIHPFKYQGLTGKD